MSIHRLNHRDYLTLDDTSLNYFEITGSTRDATEVETTKEIFTDWKDGALDIGDFKVIPFGPDNDIPNQIQEAVFPNSLAPRLQNRKMELLFEQGPFLYVQKKDGRKYYREPVEDTAIMAWLEENDYMDKLLRGATDWYYQMMIFTKFIRNREGRIGTGNIAEFDTLKGFDCRLAYRRSSSSKIPTHVAVGDWAKNDAKEISFYPLFDIKDPMRYPVSVHVSKFPSYGMEDYALPDIYGSLEWIRRSTSVPKIFKALTDNSLNIKWHIQSPQKYWDDKRKLLKDNCQAQIPPVEYKEQMLEDLKKQILSKLSSLLSGVENVGKFWHNEYVVELIGSNAMEHGWKITPIEQKIAEYVKAQIQISDKADFATLAGIGLHAALGNVGADGKSDSGSEQLYALKIHQITSVNVPEYFVCKPINDAIRIRFNKDIRVGFYHISPEREQDITESKRVTATNP